MIRPKDAYLESCLRREMRLAQQSPEISERAHRWFVGKDRDFADLKHLRRLKEQTRACGSELLMSIQQNSANKKEFRARWLEERRYRVLAMVEQRLFASRSRKNNNRDEDGAVDGDEIDMSSNALASRGLLVGGSKNGLYERMFRQQPRLFMTRAQFMTCIRTVFGLNIAATDAASDQEWLKAINLLYDSFDVDNREEMDWRRFIILLNLLIQPTLDCKVQLRWGFAIYSSEGSLDLECTDPVPLGIIKDMMCAPCTIASGLELRSMLDNAWLRLTQNDIAAKILAREQERRGRIIDQIAIPYSLFQRLLEQQELLPYFEAASTFGIRDPRTWLYRYEERFYHPILVECIQAARRRVRNQEQAVQFLGNRSERMLQQTIAVWKVLVHQRDRMRYLIIEMMHKWKFAKSAEYFSRWKIQTMQEIASTHLQRTARGFLGRRHALLMKWLHVYTIRLQSWWRGRRGLLWFRKKQRARAWAAIEIQRFTRGMLHRRLATRKLEAHIDMERRKLTKKRQQWMDVRKAKAAVQIQRKFRNLLKRRKLIERWEKETMRQAAEDEIREYHDAQRQKVLIFRRELQRWFERRKQEYLANCISEKHTHDERKKIAAYRRKQKEAERKAREDRLAVLAEREYDMRVEEWLKRWEALEKERATARKQACKQAFLEPSTAAEHALKAELKLKLQEQTKVVMQRTAALHVPLEKPEAEKIAINEVFDLEEQQERQRVKAEMKVAAEEEMRKKELRDAAEAQRLEAKRERDMRHAIVVLQGASKLWKARRKLRELALSRYRKHFDIQSISYFYEDTKTGTTTWAKPKALGMHDVQAEDVWLAMHQAEYTYYYNPLLMDMSWEAPPGTLICNKCETEFGRCYMLSEEHAYCANCFYESYVVNDPSIPFKKINGGLPGVVGMNFHMLPNSTWETVQW